MDFPKTHLYRHDPFRLIHCTEHKLAAYRYLINRTHSLPLTLKTNTKNATPFYTSLKLMASPTQYSQTSISK